MKLSRIDLNHLNCVTPDNGPPKCACGCGSHTNLIKKTDPVQGYLKGYYFKYVNRHASRGIGWYQAAAHEKMCARCGKIVPLSQFRNTNRPDRPKRYSSRCLVCDKAYKEEWCLKHPNNEQRLATYLRLYHGLTMEAYEVLILRCGNVCEICKRKNGNKRLFVDHCHSTGKIRGLLCGKCNGLLGMADDDPLVLESAIRYLQSNAIERNQS